MMTKKSRQPNPYVACGAWDVTVERRGRGWRWSLVLLSANWSPERWEPVRFDGSAPSYSSHSSAKRAAKRWLKAKGLL